MRFVHAAVFVVIAGAGTSGCAAAGLAGAPLVAAVQAVADRTVERTVLADLTTAAMATEAVLRRASIAVTERQTAPDRLTMRGSLEKVSIVATLEQVTPSLTRVSLRTETGGLLADRQTSERLQHHLAAALDRVQTARTSEQQYLDAVTALEAEVRLLREGMAKSASPAAAAERAPSTKSTSSAASPAFTIDTRGVVTVPESYGFVTVGSPQPSSAPTMPTAPVEEARGDATASRPTSGAPGAAVLRPVSAIVPIGVVPRVAP